MGSYAGSAPGLANVRDGELAEEIQPQRADAGGPEPIGTRIVSIPPQAGVVSVIPRTVEERQADVPPPDPMRMVDVQRQQDAMAKLADLVKPGATAPPVLQQRASAQTGGASAGSVNAPNRSTATKAGGSAAGQASGSGSGVQRPATAIAAKSGTQSQTGAGGARGGQGSSGSAAQQGQPGFIDRAKKYVTDAEKEAEDTALSWWHRLWHTKDGDVPNKQPGGSNVPANARGNRSGVQNPGLPKAKNGNIGDKNNIASSRKAAPAAASSDGGRNIYTPPEGQKIEDLVKEGYMPDRNGEAQCVQLIKTTMGAPPTKQWKQGQKVQKGVYIAPGTAIATFDENGNYPQNTGDKAARNQHAAIYIGQDERGIWVVDQANSRKPEDKAAKRDKIIQTRLIPWDRTDKGVSNNGSAFSVITWKAPEQKQAAPGRKAGSRQTTQR